MTPSAAARTGRRLRHRAVLAGAAALIALAGLGGLGGCAALGPQAASADPPPWADAVFTPPARMPQAADALALSPAMRDYLPQLRGAAFGGQGAARALVEALATRSGLRLEYESRTTRTAAQAFDDRAGNCLSLVLMTAAFARALEVPVVFNEALVEAQWRREGGLVLRSGHVNLTLGVSGRRGSWRVGTDESLMVDFLPGVDLRGLRTRPIDEQRVLAMFMNNRAAEALAGGDLNGAYWLVRASLQQDPGYAAARNTLGVVYQRAGQVALAGQVFEQLLALQPDEGSALGNLALVREAQGRLAEAAQLRARRDALEPQTAQALRALSAAKLAWLKAHKGAPPPVP